MGRKVTDLLGKRFGRLLVTGRDYEHRKQGRAARWFVKCDCGQEKTVHGNSLIRGLTKSCGCLCRETARRIQASQSRARIAKRQPEQSFLNVYKYQARQKGHTWTLTDEEFYALVRLPCHYCGSNPVETPWAQRRNLKVVANGIDRKDNSLGYSIDNVVPCCKVCNRAKLTMTYLDFIRYLDYLAQKQGKCWQI